MARSHDAIVVGSGPNGFGAAITLADAGASVLMIEASENLGGGLRSGALTRDGFVHDVCSAIHPLGKASPFFRRHDLESHGMEWVTPPAAAAHPLDDGSAVLLGSDLLATADGLGPDGPRYRALIEPLVRDWPHLAEDLLAPPVRIPRAPLRTARFGILALRSAKGLCRRFSGERARALFAGSAAHSILPLEAPSSAAIGLLLTILAHVSGWPLPRGGSQQVANALEARFRALGGEIRQGWRISSHEELPAARVILYDVSPPALASILGARLSPGYRRRLRRFRFGPGVFKVDYALEHPIPWQNSECRLAATVHVGGSFEEIAAAERAAWEGRVIERPFVLLTQPSLFDSSRAPAGRHTAWAYCHVPNGSDVDRSEAIESQIERFAPGFRDCVLERATRNAPELAAYNPNCVGGDITGGANTLAQVFARPVLASNPYRTPVQGVFLCSASTPPGGGVHGMCGLHAANAALRYLRL